MKVKKEAEFLLDEPIEYEDIIGKSVGILKKLTLKAPSRADNATVCKLKDCIASAMMDAQKLSMFSNANDQKSTKASKQDDGIIDSNAILMAINISANIETSLVMGLVEELLLVNDGRSCLLPNGEGVKKYILDKLSCDDFERLVGEYMANFTLPSWMKPQQKR